MNNEGRISYAALILIMSFLAFMMLAILDKRYIKYKSQELSDSILLSNLAACMPEEREIVEEINTDSFLIDNSTMDTITSENILIKNIELYQIMDNSIIFINHEKALHLFEEYMNNNYKKYGNDVKLIEFIVYQKNKDRFSCNRYFDNKWVMEDIYSTKIDTPSHKVMVNSGIYVKLEIYLDTLLYKNKKVYLDNCIMLYINENLQ